MARRSYSYVRTTLSGGINQDEDHATLRECSDARNVWAPDGILTSRPGFLGVSNYAPRYQDSWYDITPANNILVSDFGGVLTDGTGAMVFTGAVIGDKWYSGWTSLPALTAGNLRPAFLITVSQRNSASTQYKLEYWNGTVWVYLPSVETPTSTTVTNFHMGSVFPYVSFVMPTDWATTTLTGIAGAYYYIRFILKGANPTGTTQVDRVRLLRYSDTNIPVRQSVQLLKFSNKTLVLHTAVRSTGTSTNIDHMAVFNSAISHTALLTATGTSRAGVSAEPAILTSVASSNEVFFTRDYKVYVVKATPAAADSLIEATVETASFAVGTGAPYDKTLIVQESSFPSCRYLTFFQNRFWATDDTRVMWSAPAPYHKVWPSLSFEYLQEQDSSVPSGLAALGENMIVYKRNSIYQMVFTQIDGFGLARYIPRQIVSGVGCVSNASIASVRGTHVFLSEDGLYQFDGVRTRKISEIDRQSSDGAVVPVDRLQDFWATINPNRRPFAIGVNWQTKHCYLLAISTNGSSVNNAVVVWDYQRDTFWLWNNISAESWLLEDGQYGEDKLSFVDKQGQVFEFVGTHDHGTAISRYAISQRIGYRSQAKRNTRIVEVNGTNTNEATTIEVLPNDAVSGDSASLDFADYHEASYGSGVYGTSKYVGPRKRLRSEAFFIESDFIKVKISDSNKSAPFEITEIAVGSLPMGR
jgi:hypothetical protein